MKVKVHTGSLPVSCIGCIGAEMLVVVDGCMNGPEGECISRILDMLCNKVAAKPFACTTTGQQLYKAGEGGFPADRYGIRTDFDLLLGESGEVAVDGVMRAIAGLGVKTLAVFTVSPVCFHSNEYPILKHIIEWLCSHNSELTDLYVLSNAVGNSVELSCEVLLKEYPEYCGTVVNAGQVCRVSPDANGEWWYYADCGVGMVKISRVVRDFRFNLARLAVPTELDGKRVVAIDDNAFVQTAADLLSVGTEIGDWTKELEELFIPRFISQMNPRRILDSLPALKHVTIDPLNRHFVEDERMLIRQMADWV